MNYQVSQKKRALEVTDKYGATYQSALKEVLLLVSNCHIVYLSLAKSKNDFQ